MLSRQHPEKFQPSIFHWKSELAASRQLTLDLKQLPGDPKTINISFEKHLHASHQLP